MSRFVTLEKTSPEFEAYLLGSFSQKARARAVQSLNPNSNQEQVTFEILDIKQIHSPPLFNFLFEWLRGRKLVILLFPIFYFLINLQQPVQDPWLLVLAILSLILLFWSVYLHNDYLDHKQGIDRVYVNSGSRAIQNGWITAAVVKRWAWVFAAAAFVLALPVFIFLPLLFFVAAAGAGLIYFSHIDPKGIFKNQKWGIWAQGLLIGPVLALGLQVLMSGEVSVSGLGFGLVWGLMVLFVLFLHDFEKLVPSAQVGYKTWMVHLGFDQGKLFLQKWIFFFIAAIAGFQFLEKHWMIWLPGFLILLYFSYKFLNQLKRLKSPAGSEVVHIRQEGYQLFVLATTLWVIEEIFVVVFRSIMSLWT